MANSCELIELFERSYFETLAEKIYRKLQNNQDIKHVEIYANSFKNTKISFEQGFIKNSFQKKAGGIGLRIVGARGKEGMTFTSDFSDEAISLISYHAIKMMKAATPNPDFINLAFPSNKYTEVQGTYDPIIEDICPDDINNQMKPIFDLKNRTMKPIALSGGFSASTGTTFIWNSNGINQWDRFSTVGCSTEVSLMRNNVPSGGFDWQSVCQIKNLDVAKVAETSYDMAFKGLNRTSIDSGEYPLILSPLAVAHFLIDPLSDALNAERVYNQMSFLGDYLGKEIGNNQFTIHDDPFIPGKLGTESFDAEGIATEETTMVQDGVLKEFYHNSFTAGRAKIVSNGHASRGSYSGNIGISNNNIIMAPGNRRKEEMIADIKKGIYFEYTGDSPNEITGDFSGLIMTGYIIDDGILGPAVSETLLGINLLDAYKRIEEVSKERKWVDEAFVPWIKISKASISGRT